MGSALCTDWMMLPRIAREPAPGIALWHNEPEAIAILSTFLDRAPAQERERRIVGRRADEYVRFCGHRAQRLQEIHDRYVEAAMCQMDHAAFGAQRPVAAVIVDVLDGLALADVALERGAVAA